MCQWFDRQLEVVEGGFIIREMVSLFWRFWRENLRLNLVDL